MTAPTAAASPTGAAPGIARSSRFPPYVSIRVPSGWTLHEDTLGTFVLYAPSVQTSPDGSRSAIYVLAHGMLHPAGCANAVDTGQTAKEMLATLVALPGLVSTKPGAITLAGRSGYVVEVHVAPTWKESCIGTTPGVELLHGLPPTSDPTFDNGIGVGTSTAMYLLDRPEGGVMTIEVDDQSGGHDLAAYRAVVETMQFGP